MNPPPTTPESISTGFVPKWIGEVDVTRPVSPPLGPGRTNGLRYGAALLLVRMDTEPLGVVEVDLDDRGEVSPSVLKESVWAALGNVIARRIPEIGTSMPDWFFGRGQEPPRSSSYLSERSEIMGDAPFVSVVVCTRGRVQGLTRCLRHLANQEYPRFEVVVVDNAPVDDRVEAAIRELGDASRIRYVVEPRVGLSRARNRGWGVAKGELIAFADDDEAPDPFWLVEIARGFRASEGVGCVSGMILPASLDTQIEGWFEEFGGHSKGRGFEGQIFDASASGAQSALYPLPPFGAGGNMAFRRSALEAIGGFDNALGAGTPARAGEDTLAFTLVQLAGFRMVYRPSALVRHSHHADRGAFEAQIYGYGVGLTSYYMALLRQRPRLIWSLVRLAPQALRYLRGRGSPRTAGLGADLPAGLLARQRRGMLGGPVAYLRSSWQQRSPGRAVTGARARRV
jgi:glycosyltransferase involved in cell wall biosynthesis